MSTPTRKEISHERILDTASRAIRRAGFQGVGVADIMKEAGLTHGGFYAHFANRDALLQEAVRHASKQSAAALLAGMAARQAQGHSAFRALVESYLSETHLRSCESGCPIAALGSEIARQSEGVRDATRERVESLIALIRKTLPHGTDKKAALAIAGTLIGTLQLGRAFGDSAEGKACLAAGRDALLGQYEPKDME